jgi:hypothetical protein
MKVNYVCFTSNIVKAAPGEEVAMNRLTSYHWNAIASAFETSGYTPVYRVAAPTRGLYIVNGKKIMVK